MSRLGLAVLPLAMAAAVFSPARASAAAVTVESTSVSPARIVNGQEAIQTVTLAEPAPAGGVKVQLLDGNELPDQNYSQSTRNEVTVPEGQRSVSFPIRLQSAINSGNVTRLTAEFGESVAATSITVDQDPGQDVTAFTVDKPIALDQSKVTGSVKIKTPALVGGLAVDLRKLPFESSVVHAPSYVVVPAGATSTTFTMDVAAADRPRFVQLDAVLGSARQGVTVTGVPKSFSIAVLGPVRHDPSAGQNFGAVGLGNIWHPFGATIKFASDTSGITAYFDDSVANPIPSGQVGAQFRVSVDPSVPVGTKAKITATWTFGPAPVTTEITVVE